MINVKTFCQRDAQWGNDKMAGGGKLKDFGCTVTCLSSLFTYLGFNYTPKTLNQKNIYFQGNTNLIDWVKVSKLIGYKYKRVRSYNNVEVSFNVYVLKRPVLVEVNASPIGNPNGRHWVLFLGSQKAFDPWTGTITSTSKWKPTGYCLITK